MLSFEFEISPRLLADIAFSRKCSSVSSAEGVQQGDPLGPLLFCLVLHQHSLHLRSEVQTQYLDDVTLGGDCEDLVHDVQVMREASDVGLCLNLGKCEIISST